MLKSSKLALPPYARIKTEGGRMVVPVNWMNAKNKSRKNYIRRELGWDKPLGSCTPNVVPLGQRQRTNIWAGPITDRQKMKYQILRYTRNKYIFLVIFLVTSSKWDFGRVSILINIWYYAEIFEKKNKILVDKFIC